METHMMGIGQSDRRAKGRNSRPLVYLIVEIILMIVLVFVISFANIKFLTVLSALIVSYYIVMSCIPRYSKIKKRQSELKTHTHIGQ